MLTEFDLSHLADARVSELRREAEADRLADSALPSGRALRGALASGLIELAQWIDGRPAVPRPGRLQPAR